MITLYAPQIKIPTSLGWTHDASSWYLATDPSLDDEYIVKKSEDNTEKLTSIGFDYDLEPDVTYYYKVRIICSNGDKIGIFESDVNVVTSNDNIEVTRKHPIPSAVMLPTITINGNYKALDNSNFTVDISDINTTSNAKLFATSYIIEDILGKAVYDKLYDNDNLTKNVFDDVILEENTPYVLKVMHHSSSNDSSLFASLPFKTKDTRKIVLTNDISSIDKHLGTNVIIAPINDYKNMQVKVYATGLGDSILVKTYTTTSYSKHLDSSLFTNVDTDKFLVSIKVTLNDDTVIGPKYFELTTYN